jgi:excisionase family DNA binding protein
MDTINEKRFITIREVCELLGVKPSTVYQWTLAGKLPVHKVGRLNRYKMDEILDLFKVNNHAKRA